MPVCCEVARPGVRLPDTVCLAMRGGWWWMKSGLHMALTSRCRSALAAFRIPFAPVRIGVA